MKLIDKDRITAEIERLKGQLVRGACASQVSMETNCKVEAYNEVLSFLDTLEVKEVDEQKERMSECPYRQVGCTMCENKTLECNGACGWVVDYLKLKELKVNKGE